MQRGYDKHDPGSTRRITTEESLTGKPFRHGVVQLEFVLLYPSNGFGLRASGKGVGTCPGDGDELGHEPDRLIPNDAAKLSMVDKYYSGAIVTHMADSQ